eukprot:Platyproteum_vivax@DN3082_c0_g1_i1.p2
MHSFDTDTSSCTFRYEYSSSWSDSDCDTPSSKKTLDSDNTPLNVTWLPCDVFPNGRLGFCMAPGRKKEKKFHVWQRSLKKDVKRLSSNQCDMLVTLLSDREMKNIKNEGLFATSRVQGISTVHFPIKDKWIPEDMFEFHQLICTIQQELGLGKNIVVHCNGGKGRSALILCCTMMLYDYSYKEAVALLHGIKDGAFKNPAQQMFAWCYQSRFIVV